MRISETAIEGVLLVEIDRIRDHRGFFARTWCRDEFLRAGVDVNWMQANLGVSVAPFTLRGLHFQRSPHQEYKLVRCTRGSVLDVAVDLRRRSPTYLSSTRVTLSHENQQALLVPPGCAHGYLTLESDSHLEYLTSEPYVADAAGGVRFDDPVLGLDWPTTPRVVSATDRTWPDWTDDSAL